MALLNTFYMLFKSNAKEAKEGVDQLDKATKQLGSDFDKANEKANELGRNFIKLVETGAAIAGGYAGFNFFKNGAIQATEYNKQLYVTAQLTKQHAGELKALAQIAEGFSRGSGAGALNLLTTKAEFSQRVLGKDANLTAYMENLRKQYKMVQNIPAARRHLLDTIPNEGLQMAVAASDADWEKMKNTPGVKGAASLTDKQAKTAYDVEQSRADLSGSLGKLNTTIADTLAPSITKLINALSRFTNSAGGSALGAFGAAAAGIGGMALWKGLQWGVVGRMLLGGGARAAAGTAAGAAAANLGGAAFVGAGAATAAGVGLGTTAAVGGGALAAGGLAGYALVSAFQKPIEALLVKWMTRDLKTMPPRRTVSGALAAPEGGGGDDIQFWMSKGYSHDQAAGIVANMTRESAGDASARGDGGKAHGLFQWHPGRRKAILDATGIDVSTADRKQQMEAAAWEMKNGDVGFSDDYFRKLKGADAAAGYFSKNFERPADAIGEAIKRGQMALSIAAQTKAAATNITIGDIHISAPGGNPEDIAKQIKKALTDGLSDVQSKADNGRLG